MSRAEELADHISDWQLDTHVVGSRGRQWMANPLGFGDELSETGKEAVRIAKARRRSQEEEGA